MAVTTTNLGVITAYGDAVAAGYTGTKAEWQALMASYATVGQQAVDAKNAAVAAKDAAVAKATEATTAASTATTKASEASASAQSIAESAAQIQENTDDIDKLKSELSDIVNYSTPLFINDSTTITAGTTTYEANIQKYSSCIFKNESTNAAMVFYVVKDGNITNLTPNGIAKGNSFSFIAQDNYDHIRVYGNNTDLTFSFSSYPVFSSVSAIDNIMYLDKYTGTDTEKLQKCFDECLLGGTILLTRPITLEDNITIQHNSELNLLISVIGITRESIINCGNYGFVGLGAEHSNSTGGCQFINVTFKGTGVLIDGSTLIRMYLTSCICEGFTSICEATSTYMQSIYIYNSFIRGATHVITATDRTTENAYDIRLSGNSIERCVNVITVGRCFDVVVSNNLIEGLKGTPFVIYSICKMFVVRDNYFEMNGDTPSQVSNNCTLMNAYYQVDTHDAWLNGIRNIIFEGNVIHQNASDICIKVPPRVFDGAIIIRHNCCNQGILVFSDASVRLTNVIYEFNTGDYVDANNSLNIITPEKYNDLF